MAYFESSKLKNSSGNNINPAEEDSLTLLRAIFRLLKPLGFIAGSGNPRLSIDVARLTDGTAAVSSVSSVSTVSTVTNTANIGNVSAFELMKAMSRTGYNTGVRSNITIP